MTQNAVDKVKNESVKTIEDVTKKYFSTSEGDQEERDAVFKQYAADQYNRAVTSYNSLYQSREYDPDIVTKATAAKNDAVQWLPYLGLSSDKVKEYSDSLDKGLSQITDFWGSFDSKEDYDDAVKQSGYYQKYGNMTDDEINEAIRHTARGTDEYEWLTSYKNTRYRDSMLDPEFDTRTLGRIEELNGELERLKNAETLARNANRDSDAEYVQAETELDAIKKMSVAEKKNAYGSIASANQRQKELEDYLSNNDFTLNNYRVKEEQINRQIASLEKDLANAPIVRRLDVYESAARKGIDFDRMAKPTEEQKETSIEAVDLSANGNAGLRKTVTGVDAFILNTVGNNSVQELSLVEEMGKSEKNTFLYYVNKGETDKAKQYYGELRGTLEERRAGNIIQSYQDFADKYPVLSDVATVAANIVMAPVAITDIAVGLFGGEIDTNDEIHLASRFSSTVRGYRAAELGKVGGFFYQTGMSIADVLANIAVGTAAFGKGTAGAEWTSLLVMGSNAAENKIIEARMNGYSSQQAAFLGLIAGGAEILTEKVSLDRLFSAKNTVGWRNILKSLATQAFTEGSEEVASSLINIMADVLILQDDSEWMRQVNMYLEGYTDENNIYHKAKTRQEAFGMVISDKSKEIGLDFLGGALSGFVMGGGDIVIRNVSANNVAGKYIKADTVNSLVQFGKTLGGESLSIAEEVENTENPSKSQVGNLYQQISLDLSENGTDEQIAVFNALTETTRQLAETGAKLTVNDPATAAENLLGVMQEKADADGDVANTQENAEQIGTVQADNSGTENNAVQNENAVQEENAVVSSNEQTQYTNDEDIIGDIYRYARDQERIAEDIEVAKKISKAITGNDIIVEDIQSVRGVDADGYIDANGIIHLSNKAKQPILFVLKHELTHFGEGSENYNRFVSSVRESKAFDEWIRSKTNGQGSINVIVAEYTNRIIETYRNSGVELENGDGAYENAQNEMIANFVGDVLFSDNEGIDRLLSGMSRSKQNAVVRFLSDFIEWIKGKFTGSTVPFEIRRLESKLKTVLATVNENTTEDGGVKYSISDTFSEDFDKAISGDDYYKSNVVVVGKIPFLFSKFGFDTEKPMTITARHIRDITHEKVKGISKYHGLTKQNIINAIEQLESPALIIQSPINSDVYIAFSTEIDSSGNPISIYIDKNGNAYVDYIREETNHIKSIYGRDNNSNYIKKAIEEDRVVYGDKKRANKLEDVLGISLSLPDKIFNVGSNDSISDSPENVKKIFGFSIKDGVSVNEDLLEELSIHHPNAEVDLDGNITVYHRTSKENADDILKSGIMTAKEDPLFFSSKESGYADGYGNTVIKLKIPSTVLEVNDIFDGEVHFDIPLQYKNGKFQMDVSNYIVGKMPENEAQYSIPDQMDDLMRRRDDGTLTDDEYKTEVENLYRSAGEQYGTIPQGELSEEDKQVPAAVSDNKKTRRFVRTVLESGILPDDIALTEKEKILSDAASYVPISDKSAQKYADTRVSSGIAQREWDAVSLGNKVPGKNDIAVGETLLKLAAERKDATACMKLIAELSEVATRAGQTVQAMSMLKRMNGIGQLYYIQKFVDTMNRDIDQKNSKRRNGKDIPNIKINETLAEQLANSKTSGDFDITYRAITDDIANQVPSTFIDKWNAWRYMSMLFNPTTHIRNIVGNAIFMPAVALKNILSASGERVFISQENRTKSFVIKKSYRDYAKKDFEVMKDIISGGGKLNPSDEILDNRTIFKSRAVEWVRNFNFDALEKEDLVFLKRHYETALAGFLQARGINLNSIDAKTLGIARNYAVNEAQKATYRDASKMASIISRASRKGGSISRIFIEGVIPFKKTPINILKRGVEYSPIGLFRSLTTGVIQATKGNMSGSQLIDSISSGLSGSAILALGYFLASLGAVTGGLGDDKEKAFRKLNGEQEYAVNILGYNYTIDWAAPVCIPFFIGVELFNAFDNEGNASAFSDITSSVLKSLDPLTEMSMLQGIENVINTIKYEDGSEMWVSLIENIMTSYFSQALPTVAGKVANTFNDTRRMSYKDKSSEIPTSVQSMVDKIKTKVPGLSSTRTPYINAWGQEEQTGNIFGRIFQNFMSPGYYSETIYDDTNESLLFLYRSSKDESVLPKLPDKYITINGETKYLTADEYEKYAAETGISRYEYASDFVNADIYNDLSDEEKAKVLSNLYSYSLAKAKTNVSSYVLPTVYAKVYEYEKNGLSPVDWYVANAIASDTTTKKDFIDTVEKSRMNPEQKRIIVSLKEAEGKKDYEELVKRAFGQ